MGDIIRTHKELNVWKASIELATEIYKLTKGFPEKKLMA